MTGVGGLLRRIRFGHPLYGLSLDDAPTGALSQTPSDIWPGDPDHGRAFMLDSYRFFGKTLHSPTPPWNADSVPPGWLAELQSFAWLRDLRAVGGDSARSRARRAIEDWLDNHPRWSEAAWEPSVLGRRVAHWLAYHDFSWSSAPDALYQRILAALAQQGRHLAKVMPGGVYGPGALDALRGLLYAGLFLPGRATLAEQATRLLEREIAQQIRPDGGYICRSPRLQLRALRLLLDMRAALRQADKPVPESADTAILRMGRALKAMMHGDDGLAQFHDSHGAPTALARQALIQADIRGKAPVSLPESGFERQVQGRTVIVIDAGAPPPKGYDKHAHAGLLAFEMSSGRERLIVNCGAAALAGAWRNALRKTAAHSTLTIADADSLELVTGGGLRHRPPAVQVERQSADGASLLTLSHEGYRKRFGLIHRRRLYLGSEGRDLRGEDALSGSGSQPIALRFHLHPGVQASPVKGGQEFLLRLPSGQGWRFRSNAEALGLAIGLESSVYFDDGQEHRKTSQIVITGTGTAHETVIKWALQREG